MNKIYYISWLPLGFITIWPGLVLLKVVRGESDRNMVRSYFAMLLGFATMAFYLWY